LSLCILLKARLQHRPRISPGFITDLSNPPFQPPDVGGLLGANTLVTDPFSGSTVVRIADYHTSGTSPAQPSYQVDPGGSAEVNFMDMSDSYFYVSDLGACLEPFTWNAQTMQANRMYVANDPSTNGMRICTASTGGEFSYAVRGRMYDIEAGNSSNHNPGIFYYDLTQPAPPSRTKVYDFGADTGCAPSGVTYEGQTQWVDPPTVSADDQTFATAISVRGGVEPDQRLRLVGHGHRAGRRTVGEVRSSDRRDREIQSSQCPA
jgi:hypothetical protein